MAKRAPAKKAAAKRKPKKAAKKKAVQKVVMLNTLLWEINDCESEFFSVKFVKRTDSTVRVMQCRRGVKSKLKGGKPSYDAAEKKLLRVYSSADDGYRSIPVEGLVSATIGGTHYVVRGRAVADKLPEGTKVG